MAPWQRWGEGRLGVDPVDQFSPERTETRIVSAIRGHGAGVLIPGDLAQQVWQDGAVHCPTVVCLQTMRGAFSARGELDRADVGCGGVHGQTDLAPLASLLNTMFPELPLAIAEDLMPVLSVTRQGVAKQRPERAPAGSVARQHADRVFEPSGSSACGKGSSAPERASPALRAAADWRPSRRFV